MEKRIPRPTATSVLRELVDTINATGGVFRDDDGYMVPVGDRDWIDLGGAYENACEVLGIEPLLKEDEEN